MKLRLMIAMGLGLSCIASFANAATTTTNTAPNQPTTPTITTVSAPAGTAAQTPAIGNSSATLNSQMDKVSYALGVKIGQNLKTQNIQINSTAMSQGLKDGLSGGPTQLTQKDLDNVLLAFQKDLIMKRQNQFQELSTQNKQEGDTFLAANKSKPGIVTLPDGLQYKVVAAGSGTPATDQDTVTVNYEGSFLNGKVFDSSYQRGKPVTFPVPDVIPGWTEALKLMKPGATWQLYIPPNLAYGERGIGPIGPNQTLVFKVNLIAVNKGAASQTAGNQVGAATDGANQNPASNPSSPGTPN